MTCAQSREPWRATPKPAVPNRLTPVQRAIENTRALHDKAFAERVIADAHALEGKGT